MCLLRPVARPTRLLIPVRARRDQAEVHRSATVRALRAGVPAPIILRNLLREAAAATTGEAEVRAVVQVPLTEAVVRLRRAEATRRAEVLPAAVPAVSLAAAHPVRAEAIREAARHARRAAEVREAEAAEGNRKICKH